MQDRARRRFIPRTRGRVSPGSRALRRACSRPYNPHPTEAILEAFLVSLGIVALAEIGDKTQLLALVLAARYRRPVPVILGILVATLANHALAAWLGAGVAAALGPQALRWILGLSFLAMAAWTLIPDKLEKEKPQSARLGAFAATLVAFFLVEMGDKTQIATAALAARYASIAAGVASAASYVLFALVSVVTAGQLFLLPRPPQRAAA